MGGSLQYFYEKVLYTLFKNIIGQERIKERFIRSVREGRISHAQLLHGPEGIGKLALALAYAQYVSCTNRGETDACGTCASCLKYQRLEHPDLHFVFPVIKPAGKSTVVSDDFIREFRKINIEKRYFGLNDWYNVISDGGKQGMIYSNESSEIIRKLNLKTYESQYKVMIIWMPELMHEACANKVLKILEEPPPFTLFLLVSNNPSSIITTILSRTQQIKVDRLAEDEIRLALKENYSHLDDEVINDIAHISNGSYLRAINLIDESNEGNTEFEHFKELMRKAWMVGNKRNYEALQHLKKWVDQIAASPKGREGQKQFLMYSQKLIRENYIYNLRVDSLNYMSTPEIDFSDKFSPFINERNVEDLMSEFALAERHIEQNVNAKMVFFDLLLKVIMLLKR